MPGHCNKFDMTGAETAAKVATVMSDRADFAAISGTFAIAPYRFICTWTVLTQIEHCLLVLPSVAAMVWIEERA